MNYKIRVLNELLDLEKRIGRLEVFIQKNEPIENEINADYQLMCQQIQHMQKYRETLYGRLVIFLQDTKERIKNENNI